MADETSDPIGAEFYDPLVRADKLSDALFYVSALLSFAAVVVDKASTPLVHSLTHLAFALSVLMLFVASLATRLYFFPRAQLARVRDFLGHAYGRDLSHKQTKNYYNNAASASPSRVAAQVLESTFFSKAILSGMASAERAKVAVYLVIWLGLIMHRQTDIAWLAVAAQAVFSEQIVSRWLRFETLKRQCEDIYQQLFTLYQTKRLLDVTAPEQLVRYEVWKATTAFALSSSIFHRRREALNAEWESVRKTLGI